MGLVSYRGKVSKNVKSVGIHNGALILNIDGRTSVCPLGIKTDKGVLLEFSSPLDVEYMAESLCIKRNGGVKASTQFKDCEYVEIYLNGEFESITVDDTEEYYVCMDLLGAKRIVNKNNPFIIEGYSNKC